MRHNLLLGALAALSLAAPAAARDTDAQIKQRIIKQSIASYPGKRTSPFQTGPAFVCVVRPFRLG